MRGAVADRSPLCFVKHVIPVSDVLACAPFRQPGGQPATSWTDAWLQEWGAAACRRNGSRLSFAHRNITGNDRIFRCRLGRLGAWPDRA
ncbi:hypothetical protein BN1263560119 [Stenotrophomonas indicatrix]|nr:hypothetical protein BN1263560119 [Stenotrophomonas indicatrix]